MAEQEPQYIVVVGTDPETAKGEYAEHAGWEPHGPFDSYAEADEIKQEVERCWANVPSHAFVYGQPFVEVRTVRTINDVPFGRTRAQWMARNWHLDPELEDYATA